MIKEIRLQNWKSFEDATLYIDPLTVLIGANASGKSNALDSLEFLRRIANGLDVRTALGGNEVVLPLRGNEKIITNSKNDFLLEVKYESVYTIEREYYSVDYHTMNDEFLYKLHFFADADNGIVCKQEELQIGHNNPDLNFKFGTTNESLFFTSKLSHFKYYDDSFYIKNPCVVLFVFEPIPFEIRSYSRFSKELRSNASNLAGFLAALSEEDKIRIETTLSKYLNHLPERDIKKVWAEPVGRLGSDAMLYCEEEWADGQTQIIDARGMSDGTLRFLAILTALLTRPEGSLLVIEEVDNGLHPSRMHLLIQAMREIGRERNIDVLVTTHNPALLDGLEPEMMPFVQVVHRDPKTGASKITPLDDINDLPKLLASGSLGKITTRGDLEQSLKQQELADA